MITIFLGLFLIAFGIFYFHYKNEQAKAEEVTKHFPTPPRFPVLGFSKLGKTALPSVEEVFENIGKYHQKLGPNLVLHKLFNTFDLVISRSKDVETILNEKNIKKALIYQFLEPWLGEGLLVSTGKKWQSRRKIITPTFHFKILEQFVEVFNEQDAKMVKILQKYAKNNEDCNIHEHFNGITLDIICETAMGVRINAQDDPNSEYILAVKEFGRIIFERFFGVLGQFPSLWSLTSDAKLSKKVIKVMHDFTDSVISDRRKTLQTSTNPEKTSNEEDELLGKKQRLSFLDMLLQATTSDGKPLSDLDIREEVDTFMFEGHDTTTSGLTFTCFNLATHPEVQIRVFEEIIQIMGDDPSTPFSFSNLQDMKYLEKVIKESLRLYPSVPIIAREVVAPIEIQGVTIPKGVSVIMNIYNLHRNPKVFPNPEVFDPERFDEEKERSWGPFDYIPFSAGSRNCIGQKFAMLEMKSVIASLVRNFKIVPGAKLSEMKYISDSILRPINGMHVRLEKREKL